jgi:hypothetical protein
LSHLPFKLREFSEIGHAIRTGKGCQELGELVSVFCDAWRVRGVIADKVCSGFSDEGRSGKPDCRWKFFKSAVTRLIS